MNSERLPRIHRIEDEFHDLKAQRARDSAALYTWGALRHADNYAHNLLGDLKDKVIIDMGCGAGHDAVRFARKRAMVHAFDLSAGMVNRTKILAEENGLADLIIVQRMAAEDLSYPSNWADLVFGHSILHHLDIPLAIREIHRILKPGGRAVFLEPLAHNPMINLFRRVTPSRRTVTEVPLTFTDITFITGLFSQSNHREFYLLALGALLLIPLRRKGLFGVALDRLVAFDEALMRRIPTLAKFCWVTVMEVVK